MIPSLARAIVLRFLQPACKIFRSRGGGAVLFINSSRKDFLCKAADGNRLEHIGVAPDEMLLPTAEELSQSVDPVPARAAALVGIRLEAKKAGTLFPVVWKYR